MSKRAILKNIFLLLVIVFIVYFFAQHAGAAQNQLFSFLNIPGSSVKGASTEKAQEVTGKLGSDVGNGLEQIKQQALQVSLGDALSGLSRLQKIPQDFHTVQEFVKGQVNHVIQSRN